MQQRTVFNRCYCGALQDLYDPAGNRTHWDWDIGGRLVRSTDAENQTRQIEYAPDNQVTQISYLNARVATPAVSFKYGPVYGRLQEMQDGAPRCLVQLDAVTAESCDAADRRKVNTLSRFTYAYATGSHLQLETVQAPNGRGQRRPDPVRVPDRSR